MYERFVAIGDSFTEGVGDDLPDGQVRGWADLVALGLAAASPTPVAYANFAIRGKLLGPIVADQLGPALALRPDLLTVSGGGNDLMRPRVEIGYIIDLLQTAVDRAREAGTHVVLLSGGNPSRHLPMGSLMQRRGDALASAWYAAFGRAGCHPGRQLVGRRTGRGPLLVSGQAPPECTRPYPGRDAGAGCARRAGSGGVDHRIRRGTGPEGRTGAELASPTTASTCCRGSAGD